MPELPEVETTRLGIQSYIENQTVTQMVIRQPQLRWPIPCNLPEQLQGKIVQRLTRRGKYLLFEMGQGALIVHLGMSGSLGILKQKTAPKKHDHVDIMFANNIVLRFTDPRRFGSILWAEGAFLQHALLAKLGVEPLTTDFSAQYLWHAAQRRKKSIKSFIMDNHIVVGVGNIYATEALFLAGIHPQRPAGLVSEIEMTKLVDVIKNILTKAIQQGGTTLKDFVNGEGKPGYFSQQLQVYGRQGFPCFSCNKILQSMRIGQRTSVYCLYCQV
jgi:formamidopyrimidine-DNA glycosylase